MKKRIEALVRWVCQKLKIDLRPWPDPAYLDLVRKYSELYQEHASWVQQNEKLSTNIIKYRDLARDLLSERDGLKVALERMQKGSFEAPQTVWAIVNRARELVHIADLRSAEGTTGEYKRHNVYSRLLKEFPEVPKRDVGLAIELAVR